MWFWKKDYGLIDGELIHGGKERLTTNNGGKRKESQN